MAADPSCHTVLLPLPGTYCEQDQGEGSDFVQQAEGTGCSSHHYYPWEAHRD